MHAARRVAVRRAPTVFGASARRTYSLEVFNNSSSILGEGALWHASNVLYWIDIKGDSPKPSFNIFNPSSNTNKRFYLPSRVGTVVPVSGDADVVVLALEDGLYTLNVKTSVLASVLPMRKASEATRMNDGKCDPLGRFWVGTMFGREWVDNAGTLYSIDRSLAVSPKLAGVTISNGIVWAGTTMYYIDTMTFTIDAFDFDVASGAISNRRPIYHLPRDKSLGFADGMALDADGNLWVACFNGGCVLQIDPKRGTCLRELVLPTTQVTSVAFGGPALEDLYITTAREDIPAEKLSEPGFLHAGKLFRVTGLGVKGVPAAEFKVDAAALRAAQATAAGSIVTTVETTYTPQMLRA